MTKPYASIPSKTASCLYKHIIIKTRDIYCRFCDFYIFLAFPWTVELSHRSCRWFTHLYNVTSQNMFNKNYWTGQTWQPKMYLFLHSLPLRRTFEVVFVFGFTRMCMQFSFALFNSGCPGAQLRVSISGENSAPAHQPHSPLHPACMPPNQ